MSELTLFGDPPAQMCARAGCKTSLVNHREDAVWCSRACYQAQRRADRRAGPAEGGSGTGRAYAGRTDDERMAGLKPSARRVLDLLRTVGSRGAVTAQLCQPDLGGARFGARILELRQAGFEIANVRERQGSDRYTLADPADHRRPAPPIPLREPDGSHFTPARENRAA